MEGDDFQWFHTWGFLRIYPPLTHTCGQFPVHGGIHLWQIPLFTLLVPAWTLGEGEGGGTLIRAERACSPEQLSNVVEAWTEEVLF